MKRTAKIFPVVLLMAALATTLTGTGGADNITGTAQADDNIKGGGGDDHILSADERKPAEGVTSCGPGHDMVDADARDTVADDCEKVTR